MRLGFFLGFLIGAAVASALSKAERGEAPPSPREAARKLEAGVPAARDAIEQFKQQAREAMDAAREAADEKEAEMRRQFEESTRRD